MIYLIDVREKNEVDRKYLKSNDENKRIINIPNSIMENFVDKIIELSQNGGILYLFCRSGSISSTLKNTYFKHINNIVSIGTIEDTSRVFNLPIVKK